MLVSEENLITFVNVRLKKYPNKARNAKFHWTTGMNFQDNQSQHCRNIKCNIHLVGHLQVNIMLYFLFNVGCQPIRELGINQSYNKHVCFICPFRLCLYKNMFIFVPLKFTSSD